MVVTVWQIDMIVSGASIGLLLLLLFIYGRNLRQVRSPFAIGLFLFAFLFLVENILSIQYFLQMEAWGVGAYAAWPMLFVGIAEVAAFAVLAWISWE